MCFCVVSNNDVGKEIAQFTFKFKICHVQTICVYICVIQSLWLCVLFQLFCRRLYWQEQGHLVSGLQEVTLQQVSITIKYIPPVLFAYLPDVTQHPWLISVLLLHSSNPVLKAMWPEGKLSITEVTKRPLTAATLFKNSMISLVENLASKVGVFEAFLCRPYLIYRNIKSFFR